MKRGVRQGSLDAIPDSTLPREPQLKTSLERDTAGCPEDKGPIRTGFAEKPFAVSPSDGGKKRNSSAHLPPASLSVA